MYLRTINIHQYSHPMIFHLIYVRNKKKLFIQIAYYTQAITIKKPANIQKKTKKHKHIYVNVGEIFDRRGPYRLKSSDCFMKVQTTDNRSEVGLSM